MTNWIALNECTFLIKKTWSEGTPFHISKSRCWLHKIWQKVPSKKINRRCNASFPALIKQLLMLFSPSIYQKRSARKQNCLPVMKKGLCRIQKGGYLDKNVQPTRKGLTKSYAIAKSDEGLRVLPATSRHQICCSPYPLTFICIFIFSDYSKAPEPEPSPKSTPPAQEGARLRPAGQQTKKPKKKKGAKW